MSKKVDCLKNASNENQRLQKKIKSIDVCIFLFKSVLNTFLCKSYWWFCGPGLCVFDTDWISHVLCSDAGVFRNVLSVSVSINQWNYGRLWWMWCVLPHIFVEPVCLSFWVSFSMFMMHICNCRLFLQIAEIIF